MQPLFSQYRAETRLNNGDLITDLSSQTSGILYNRKGENISINPNHYINTDFVEAKVDGYSDPNKYRYNIYSDHFEFLDEKKDLMTLVKNNNKIRFKNGTVYQYNTVINEKNEPENKYLEYLTDDNINFALLKSIKTKELPIENVNGYSQNNIPKFKTEIKYYIKGNDVIKEVTTKKGNNLFDAETNAYIKKNKLNLKNENHLIEIIKYLNK